MPWIVALAGVLVVTWVVNVSLPGTRVEGCPACRQEVAPAPRRAGTLRIMSLNVLHGFPKLEGLAQRLDLIAAEIRDSDADIVCLQEVP